MKKKLFTIWIVLLISILAVSPVAAGGISVKWGQGSITVDITAWGFARGMVNVIVSAQGYPVTTCTLGADSLPGVGQEKNTVQVAQLAEVDENGKFKLPFLEAEPDFTGWNAVMLGCPSIDYVAVVDWVNWSHTSITIKDASGGKNDGKVLFYRQYYCTSTQNSVDCTAPKGKG